VHLDLLSIGLSTGSQPTLATGLSNAVISADQYISLLSLNLVAVAILKIVVLSGGYFTIYLGYKLLVAGVKGEFKFRSSLAGAKADLVSVSPGSLFVLLGVALMVAALSIKFEMPLHQNIQTSAGSGTPNPPLPAQDPFASQKKEDRQPQ
jgi:hypothetical protein